MKLRILDDNETVQQGDFFWIRFQRNSHHLATEVGPWAIGHTVRDLRRMHEMPEYVFARPVADVTMGSRVKQWWSRHGTHVVLIVASIIVYAACAAMWFYTHGALPWIR